MITTLDKRENTERSQVKGGGKRKKKTLKVKIIGGARRKATERKKMAWDKANPNEASLADGAINSRKGAHNNKT